MPKTGNVAQLSELIRQRTESDRQQIEQQTSEQLRQHAESLTQLSADALSSTKGVIDARNKAMATSLANSKKQIEAQQQTLQDQIEAQTKRLIWLLRMPVLAAILATLAVCLILCAGTWIYWKAAAPWKTVQMGNGLLYQVLKGDGWTTCTLEEGRKAPCKLAGSD